MHHSTLLQDLAIVLTVAGLVTILFNRLKQPVVLGYILAGFIIGPHTPPATLVRDEGTINTLAELGIIFLMFALGLEFSFKKLKAVGAPALLAATLEIVVMVSAGYGVGQAFGWGFMDSLFLGGILAISSTTIIIKALKELGASREGFAQLIFGILVVEDILGILMIALLSGIATKGSLEVSALLGTTWKLGVFLSAIFVAGILVVPRLLAYVARFRNSEMLLVTALALCFGVSSVALAFEYSVALGAFLIGAIIAETREARQIESLTEPLRDLFGAVFFVSVGMMINPKAISSNLLVIAVVSTVVIVGKVVACTIGAFLAGENTRTSAKVGFGLSQIGEFSFIIAGLGISKGVTSEFLYPVAVTVSAITTLTTPYLIRGSDAMHDSFVRMFPARLSARLDAYTNHVKNMRAPGLFADANVRKALVQLVLNSLLLSALFSGAVWLASFLAPRFAMWDLSDTWGDTLVWTLTMLVTMPLQIATVRRIFRVAGVLREKLAERARARGTTRFAITVLPLLFATAGTIVFAGMIVVFGAAILPPVKAFLFLVVALTLVAFLFRRHAVGVYKSFQAAFESTLESEYPHDEALAYGHGQVVHGQGVNSGAAGSALPASADISTIVLSAGSPLAGRFIKESELRKITGASIVCIEREGRSVVNPTAEEVLLAGDRIFLFGRPEQIRAACAWLTPA